MRDGGCHSATTVALSRYPAGRRRSHYGHSNRSQSHRCPAIGLVPRPVQSLRFSNDEILDATSRWTSRYGEPPTTLDRDSSRARRLGQAWRAERFEAGKWPTAKIVRGRSKLFSAAAERADLAPRRIAANLAGPEAVTAALMEWTRGHGCDQQGSSQRLYLSHRTVETHPCPSFRSSRSSAEQRWRTLCTGCSHSDRYLAAPTSRRFDWRIPSALPTPQRLSSLLDPGQQGRHRLLEQLDPGVE
jgi:hypothetical protein